MGSTFEATLKVGHARKRVKESIGRLNVGLDRVNQQLQEERVSYEQAKNYLNKVNLRRSQLSEMSELVAEGHLTEGDLHIHQQQFEELLKLPQINPLLQRGIDRIRQEEEESKKKEVEIVKPVETVEEAKTYTLPDGKVIGSKTGELLYYLSRASEESPISRDVLAQRMYPADKDGDFAKNKISALISNTRQRIPEGSGVEIVRIFDRAGKQPKGNAAGYYLRKQEESNEIVVAEPPKITSKVDTFLHELPREQEEARSLFTQVIDSSDFVYVRDVARTFGGEDPKEIEKLKAAIAGYLFETLSYLRLGERFSNQNQILLSPQETFEIYSILFPQRREFVDKYRLQRSIQGISVPDGMLVTFLEDGRRRGVRFDGVLEYKLGVRDDSETTDKLAMYPLWFEETMHFLRSSDRHYSNTVKKYLSTRLRNFPRNIFANPNAEVYLALPLDAKKPKHPIQGITEISIPVSTITFGNFINALVSDAQEKSGVS